MAVMNIVANKTPLPGIRTCNHHGRVHFESLDQEFFEKPMDVHTSRFKVSL